MFLVVIVIPLL